MLHKVVIGIDGSAGSDRALDWCVRAFSDTETEILLVSCRVAREQLGDAAERELVQMAEHHLKVAGAKLEAAGLAFRHQLVSGDARSVLLDVARTEDAELIVVGSRGRSPLTQLVLGSVASYLTHHSPYPVTIVR